MQGIFSVKSFNLEVESRYVRSSLGTPAACLAWKGLAPPHAEILVWFVLQGRLNTKERLMKLNIISTGSDLRPFFSEASETVEHLFFDCHCGWIAVHGGISINAGLINLHHLCKHGVVLSYLVLKRKCG